MRASEKLFKSSDIEDYGAVYFQSKAICYTELMYYLKLEQIIDLAQ